MKIRHVCIRTAVLTALAFQMGAAELAEPTSPPARAPRAPRGEKPARPVPPVPPEAVLEEERDLIEVNPRLGEEIAGRVQMEVERARREAEKHLGELNSGLARLGHSFSTSNLRMGGPRSFRALVLPSGEADADTGAIREELSIMTRVLERALNEEGERRARPFKFEFGDFAMGARSELDAMYLEGYGAVFFLEVDYPLAPGPVKAAKPEPKEGAEDDVWDKARREVRGEPEPGEDDDAGLVVMETRKPARAYEAEAVESLRGRVVGVLRQARNLKCLRDGETVTVVVLGPGEGERGGARRGKTRTVTGGGSRVTVYTSGGDAAGRGQTVMTFRVRKSDLSGNAKDDAFASRVKVTARHEGAVAGGRAKP